MAEADGLKGQAAGTQWFAEAAGSGMNLIAGAFGKPALLL